MIYLPRDHDGIGIKRVSDVYRTMRLAFLVKMLNHPVEQFRNAARESLILDMKKRKVAKTTNNFNFLGYDLKENGYLNSKTSFGCQSDWPDMLRYARKLNVDVLFKEDRAVIKIADSYYDDNCALQKVIFDSTVERDLERAKTLSIQGPFLGLKDIQLKASHSILYN